MARILVIVLVVISGLIFVDHQSKKDAWQRFIEGDVASFYSGNSPSILDNIKYLIFGRPEPKVYCSDLMQPYSPSRGKEIWCNEYLARGTVEEQEFYHQDKARPSEWIMTLQTMLISLGFEPSESGFWDKETKAAVIKFQRDNQLPLSGFVDESTIDLLNKLFEGQSYLEPSTS